MKARSAERHRRRLEAALAKIMSEGQDAEMEEQERALDYPCVRKNTAGVEGAVAAYGADKLLPEA